MHATKKQTMPCNWKAYIFFLHGTFLAVVGIRDSGASTDDASALVRPIVALVADPDQGGRSHHGVTDRALAIAFLAQPANCNAWLLHTHDQICMQ